MISLRTRLFLILIVSTSAIWISGFTWIFLGSRAEIERLLDRRLMEAARMVVSIAAAPEAMTANRELAIPEGEGGLSANASYEHRLSCQIWSFDGHLVGRSSNAPAARLTDEPSGFSEPVVDGVAYRVFAAEDAAKGVRVLVGDNLETRRQIVSDLLRGLLVPAAVILPIVALLIWASIRRGLAPLRRVAEALSGREAENLTSLDVGRSPPEIQPLIAALNGLFEKVAAAREHERSFLAYAAHELRTPLAGLKTQVQIAARATDPAMRTAALNQTLKGVDRTSRLVRQLLAMSKLDARTARRTDPWLDLHAALVDTRNDLSRDLRPDRIVISPSIERHSIAMDRELFDLAVGNLMENALQFTPEGGTVRLSLAVDTRVATLAIDDEGPGITEDEQGLVLQRFFRGRHKTATGSGLGLSIVIAALECGDARLSLKPTRTGHGLSAQIELDADRIRRHAAGPASDPATACSVPLVP